MVVEGEVLTPGMESYTKSHLDPPKLIMSLASGKTPEITRDVLPDERFGVNPYCDSSSEHDDWDQVIRTAIRRKERIYLGENTTNAGMNLTYCPERGNRTLLKRCLRGRKNASCDLSMM